MTLKKWLALVLTMMMVLGLVGGVAAALAEGDCPAAPSVANEILKNFDIGNRYNSGLLDDRGKEVYINLVANVAQEMTNEAAFPAYNSRGNWDGETYIEKCNKEGYYYAVYNYLSKLGVAELERFSPDSLEGLGLWLDADSIEGLNNGDPVGTWEDLSGEEHDATQSDSNKRPLYKTNVLNGKPVVRFDGTDDVLETTFGSSQPITIFAVAKGGTGDRDFRIIDGANRVALFGWDNMKFRMFAGTSIETSAGVRTTGFHLLCGIANTTNSRLFVDGELKASGNIGTNTLSNATIGRSDAANQTHDGDIAEIIVYNRVLSEEERIMVEAYLSAKYDL